MSAGPPVREGMGGRVGGEKGEGDEIMGEEKTTTTNNNKESRPLLGIYS